MASLPALLHRHHQGKLCSTALGRPPSAAIGRRQGLLSCFHALKASSIHTFRASSTVLPSQSTGPTLPKCCSLSGTGSTLPLSSSGLAHPCLCCQGQLHCVTQARYRTHSSECYGQEEMGPAFPLSCPWGQLFQLPQLTGVGSTRASSAVQASGVPALMAPGPPLPTAAGGERHSAGGHHAHTTTSQPAVLGAAVGERQLQPNLIKAFS